MKKFMLFATVVAMSLVFAVPANAQSRKEKKAAAKAQKEREEEEAWEKELKNQKREGQLAKIKSKNQMEQVMEGGVQLIYTPCMDEFLALNKVRGQMAAQGISSGQPTQESAEINANRVGLADLTSRFLGVIKNGVEQYSKDTSTPDKRRAVEAQLEGLATSIGEKAINELFVVDCRQFGKDRYNNYVCYEAIYVPVAQVVDAIIDEAVKKVDIDKALFRKRMQAELDANAAKENKALEDQRAELEY